MLTKNHFLKSSDRSILLSVPSKMDMVPAVNQGRLTWQSPSIHSVAAVTISCRGELGGGADPFCPNDCACCGPQEQETMGANEASLYVGKESAQRQASQSHYDVPSPNASTIITHQPRPAQTLPPGNLLKAEELTNGLQRLHLWTHHGGHTRSPSPGLFPVSD